MRQLEAIPLQSGTTQGFPLSPYLFNIVLEVLARTIRQQKEIKGLQIGKEEMKVSLFAADMIIYISDLQNSTRELLQLISNLSKVARYKINYSNKSVAFLCINDKQAEKEIRETTPFIMATHNIKYLGVTITKQGKAYMTISSSLSRKKSRKILENGDIFHAHGLTKLI